MQSMIFQNIHQLARTCRVFDMGMDYYVGMPHHPNHPPFAFSLTKVHGDMVYEAKVSAANCLFTTGGHTGTHMDALGHIAVDGHVQGVGDISEWQSYQGLQKAGIDQVAPVVTRGVLLDIAGLHGTDCLTPEHGIDSEDLQAACNKQDVAIQPGDAVLIRTGWIKHYAEARAYVSHHKGCPGLVESGARWLVAQGAAHVGGDTLALEKTPSASLPVHQILLVQNGIHILEVLNLNDLALENVYEFLFVTSPLKIRGGTASPVRPIAVTWPSAG